MAPTGQGPKSPQGTGEVEGLSTVLDAGLFGDDSLDRYERLRNGLREDDSALDLDGLGRLGQKLHDKELSIKEALKAYKKNTDTRRWPIFVVKPNTSQEKLEDRVLTLGFEIVPPLASAYRKVGLIPLRIPPEFSFLEALSRRPDISRIERSWLSVGAATPAPDSKGLLTYPDELVNAESLDKDFFSKRDPVCIGLLDSGIDSRHPDLQTHMIDQRAFRIGEERVGDRYGHGTAVAGTITKLCPSALFYSAKVLSEHGDGNLDDLVRAVGWLRRKKPDLIICSVMTAGMDARGHSILSRLFEDLAATGVPVIVPASNPEGDLSPPGDAQGVISVGMTKASISTRATLLARGDQLRVPRSIQADKALFPLLQPNGFTSFESPAAAAAIVAGTAALLIRAARRARRPATGSEILSALLAGCDPSRNVLDPQSAIERYIKALAEAPTHDEPMTTKIDAEAKAIQDLRPPKRTRTPTGARPLGTLEEASTAIDVPALGLKDYEEVPTVTFPAHQLATGAHAPVEQSPPALAAAEISDQWDEINPEEIEEDPTMAMDDWLLPNDKKK